MPCIRDTGHRNGCRFLPAGCFRPPDCGWAPTAPSASNKIIFLLEKNNWMEWEWTVSSSWKPRRLMVKKLLGLFLFRECQTLRWIGLTDWMAPPRWRALFSLISLNWTWFFRWFSSPKFHLKSCLHLQRVSCFHFYVRHELWKTAARSTAWRISTNLESSDSSRNALHFRFWDREHRTKRSAVKLTTAGVVTSFTCTLHTGTLRPNVPSDRDEPKEL